MTAINIEQAVIDWIKNQLEWQKEALSLLLSKGKLEDTDINDLVELCKTPPHPQIKKTRSYSGINQSKSSATSIRLSSIHTFRGIDCLQPKKPLNFSESPLIVIYGKNGSGKSGYVRALNAISGKPNIKSLKHNVYETEIPREQSFTIKYRLDETEYEEKWDAKSGPLEALRSIDIFDSGTGQVYVKDNEATYVLPVLKLFDNLGDIYGKVSEKLNTERDKLVSQLPSMPFEYFGTQAESKYKAIKDTIAEDELNLLLTWEESDDTQLKNLRERLTGDPTKKAKDTRELKNQVNKLLQQIENMWIAIGPVGTLELKNQKKLAKDKREIASRVAKETLSSSTLEGVGTETWLALWEAARLYSQTIAYPTAIFPNIENHAKCVLCQQELDANSAKRLTEFEDFIKGALETEAKEAEAQWVSAKANMPKPLLDESLATYLSAAGLEDEDLIKEITSFFQKSESTISYLISPENIHLDPESRIQIFPWIEEDCAEIENTLEISCPWITTIRTKVEELEASATKFDADAKGFNPEPIKKEIKELKAKQWISQQNKAVKNEVERLKNYIQYTKWIKSAETTAITKKAGELSESLITPQYINRFKEELKKLGASHIKVALEKTANKKGKAMHAIKLPGAPNASVHEILSEGEKRITELAAFLADMTNNHSLAPFIFDDPISSLDQDFEEKTIDRLIELSKTRQVIIFTHRLSFLGILQGKAKDPNVICIREEHWGTGEPGDIPITQKKPDNALRNLKNDRLSDAEKAYNENGSEAYYPLAKAICTDVRILLERVVEIELFADVIQRHRHDIQTKGKIEKLSKINDADCRIIDDYMTKYSPFLHSQSPETPLEIPSPQDISQDIDEILEWINKFKERDKKK